MSRSRSFPSGLMLWLVLILISLLVAFGMRLISAGRHERELSLLRAEHALLEQEIRLLRQQIEAERLQSAALVQRLRATLPAPSVPAGQPPPPPL